VIDIDKLRAHTRAELGRWNVPAVELAIVKDGKVVLAEGIGRRDVAKNLPATPKTRFHHGSTGKAFTGVLAGTLVDAGLLEWDRPIREYLPEFRVHDRFLSDRITVADLLSHRSGLARHEFAWLSNPSISRAELVQRLPYLESKFDIRTTFQYSNLAYVTVGHLIATLTGSTWEEQMRERVLEPLGMLQTVTSVDEALALEHAQPYVQKNGKHAAIQWRRTDQIAPAGQMISCAEDIARWLLFQLSDGELDGRRVLKSETLAETKRPRTPVDFPGPDPDIRFHGYAFGWMIGAYRGRRLVWHNGGVDGFHTEIALLPDDGIAVAASSNILQTNLPLAVVFHCIDTLLGEKPKPWSKNLRAESEAAPAPQRPRVVKGTQPSHPLEEYAGEYEHPGYGTLQVSLRGKGLRVQLSELDVSTKHRHFDTWTIGYAPLGADWPLTFLTDADGQVSAAEMPLEPTIKAIRFERGKPPQTAARDAKT
jgi:CubicO group peptidase (beta-lactamase class C family)